MSGIEIHRKIETELEHRAWLRGFSSQRYAELAILAYDPAGDIEAFAEGETTETLRTHAELTKPFTLRVRPGVRKRLEYEGLPCDDESFCLTKDDILLVNPPVEGWTADRIKALAERVASDIGADSIEYDETLFTGGD